MSEDSSKIFYEKYVYYNFAVTLYGVLFFSQNLFSVTSINVEAFGDDFKCAGDPEVTYNYYPSVDGKTNFRATAEFDYILTGLNYRK